MAPRHRRMAYPRVAPQRNGKVRHSRLGVNRDRHYGFPGRPVRYRLTAPNATNSRVGVQRSRPTRRSASREFPKARGRPSFTNFCDTFLAASVAPQSRPVDGSFPAGQGRCLDSRLRLLELGVAHGPGFSTAAGQFLHRKYDSLSGIGTAPARISTRKGCLLRSLSSTDNYGEPKKVGKACGL